MAPGPEPALAGTAEIALGSDYRRYLLLLLLAFVAMLLQSTWLFVSAGLALLATGIWGFWEDRGFRPRSWEVSADQLTVDRYHYRLRAGDRVHIWHELVVDGAERSPSAHGVWRMQPLDGTRVRWGLLFGSFSEATAVRHAIETVTTTPKVATGAP